jgi:hypothetical protein
MGCGQGALPQQNTKSAKRRAQERIQRGKARPDFSLAFAAGPQTPTTGFGSRTSAYFHRLPHRLFLSVSVSAGRIAAGRRWDWSARFDSR